MPQLVPFYFLNQLSFSFLTLIVLIFVLSKYILPLFTYRNVVRLYLTKLSNKSQLISLAGRTADWANPFTYWRIKQAQPYPYLQPFDYGTRYLLPKGKGGL